MVFSFFYVSTIKSFLAIPFISLFPLKSFLAFPWKFFLLLPSKCSLGYSHFYFHSSLSWPYPRNFSFYYHSSHSWWAQISSFYFQLKFSWPLSWHSSLCFQYSATDLHIIISTLFKLSQPPSTSHTQSITSVFTPTHPMDHVLAFVLLICTFFIDHVSLPQELHSFGKPFL